MDGYYPLNSHFRVPTVPRALGFWLIAIWIVDLVEETPKLGIVKKPSQDFKTWYHYPGDSSLWQVWNEAHIFRENPQHLLVQHHLPHRICQGFPYHWTKPHRPARFHPKNPPHDSPVGLPVFVKGWGRWIDESSTAATGTGRTHEASSVKLWRSWNSSEMIMFSQLARRRSSGFLNNADLR